ncbi:MAG TPA: metalloregulator ArsR/SmtB family transcription factor [Chitinophagales bacterium]|nr:metalloregulator ArsR/SmtB family transcription factor [Chitinophagales bacterium]
MAFAKTESFRKEETELARIARAMAHPARIAILNLLAKKSECICGDIVDELPLSQATVSQHLKALKEAGLIAGEIDGPRVCYCLNADAISRAKTLFDKIFQKMNCC